jgi:hypothetical protein
VAACRSNPSKAAALASDDPETPDVDGALEDGLSLLVRPRELRARRLRTRWSLEVLELGPVPRRTRVAWTAAEARVEEGEGRGDVDDAVLTLSLPPAAVAAPFLFRLRIERDSRETTVGWRRCLVRAPAAT